MAQTLILTGCASGIGKHLARELYALGHRLVLTDINEEGLNAAATENRLTDSSRLRLRRLDVRDAGQWDALIDETVRDWGRLDVVFNIAGYLKPAWASEATPEDVDRTMDINAKGLMYGTNAALRTMIKQRAGHIINVASLAALVPVPGLAIYSASKHAARAYSIAVGIEARKHNVYVTAVCPTVVATPMMDIQIDREQAALTFSGKRPLTVEEVSRAIIERAMPKRPLELVLDVPGTGQGLVAKIGNLVPDLNLWFGNRVAELGRSQQRKLRAG